MNDHTRGGHSYILYHDTQTESFIYTQLLIRIVLTENFNATTVALMPLVHFAYEAAECPGHPRRL